MTELSPSQLRDRRHLWHPFTQHETEAPPFVVERASGASLFTEDGDEILDLISSWWTCIHGHGRPEVVSAMTEQAQRLDHVMFAGFTHPAAIEIGQSLSDVLPGDLNRVFFSDDGSTAVEVALKMVWQACRNRGDEARTKFLAFDGAYHGDTFGAMSVGVGCGYFSNFAPLMFDVKTLPWPEVWDVSDPDTEFAEKEAAALAALDATLDQHGHSIAGLIVEPLMQGAAGIRFARAEFIRKVVDRVRAHDILVIFDEVAVGFGRTGTLFAMEQVERTPDVVCLSKGLTAGMLPMSVTVASDKLYDTFLGADFAKALAHGHSFTANPIACAVSLASLKLFEADGSLARIGEINLRHSEFVRQLEDHDLVVRGRTLGSIFACELAGEGGYKSQTSLKLRDWFLSHGLNIRPLGNTIYLMPPYCISDSQLDQAYQGILDGLDAVVAKAVP